MLRRDRPLYVFAAILSLAGVCAIGAALEVMNHADKFYLDGSRLSAMWVDEGDLYDYLLYTYYFAPGEVIDVDDLSRQMRVPSLWVRVAVDGQDDRAWSLAGFDYRRGALPRPERSRGHGPIPYRLLAVPYWQLATPFVGTLALLVLARVLRRRGAGSPTVDESAPLA